MLLNFFPTNKKKKNIEDPILSISRRHMDRYDVMNRGNAKKKKKKKRKCQCIKSQMKQTSCRGRGETKIKITKTLHKLTLLPHPSTQRIHHATIAPVCLSPSDTHP